MLCLVKVDLGLVEPGADVSHVLVKNLHLVLVTLQRNPEAQQHG